MMGNAVQCAVWCERQYDGDATSGGYRAEGHQTGFVTHTKYKNVKKTLFVFSHFNNSTVVKIMLMRFNIFQAEISYIIIQIKSHCKKYYMDKCH